MRDAERIADLERQLAEWKDEAAHHAKAAGESDQLYRATKERLHRVRRDTLKEAAALARASAKLKLFDMATPKERAYAASRLELLADGLDELRAATEEKP